MKAAPAVCINSMQKYIHSFDGHGPGETACVVNGGVVDGGRRPPATPRAAALPDMLVDHTLHKGFLLKHLLRISSRAVVSLLQKDVFVASFQLL